MRVSYSEEAIADLVDALSFLKERSPAAAARLDASIILCLDRLAASEFEGPISRLPSGDLVRSWPVPPLRIYYQRYQDELFVVRVYHQSRRPIAR